VVGISILDCGAPWANGCFSSQIGSVLGWQGGGNSNLPEGVEDCIRGRDGTASYTRLDLPAPLGEFSGGVRLYCSERGAGLDLGEEEKGKREI